MKEKEPSVFHIIDPFSRFLFPSFFLFSILFIFSSAWLFVILHRCEIKAQQQRLWVVTNGSTYCCRLACACFVCSASDGVSCMYNSSDDSSNPTSPFPPSGVDHPSTQYPVHIIIIIIMRPHPSPPPTLVNKSDSAYHLVPHDSSFFPCHCCGPYPDRCY